MFPKKFEVLQENISIRGVGGDAGGGSVGVDGCKYQHTKPHIIPIHVLLS